MKVSTLIFSLLCITLIPGFIFGMFWYLIAKKGWNSYKLLSVSITLILSTVVFFLWLNTEDNALLIGGILISIFQGVIIFNWPFFSDRIVKRLNMRK
jgi:inner membrane protein involved in colicin E2 resistance